MNVFDVDRRDDRGAWRPARPSGPGPSEGPAQPVEDDDAIDIRGLFLTIWRGKWIIAVCIVLALAAGWLAASQMRPTWTATGSVLFTEDRSRIVDLGEGVSVQDGTSRDGLQNEMEILRSTSLLDRVVERLNLERDADFNPALRTETTPLEAFAEWRGALMSDARDLLASWGVVSPPEPPPFVSEEERARNLRRGVIANLRGRIRLQPVEWSRVMRISATADDPATAARISNTLVDEFIVGQLEARLEATREATTWLSARVDELRTQVQEAEARVTAARAEIAEETGQGVEVTRQQLSTLNSALAEARARRSDAATRLSRLESELAGDGDLGAVPEIRQSDIISELRAGAAQIRTQEASLAGSVEPSHPARARLRERLEEIDAAIRDEAGRIAATLRNEVQTARATEAALLEEVRAVEAVGEAQARSDVRLRQLEREAEASRVLYENFLGRLKETSEQEKLEEAGARVLSPAEPPLGPDSASGRRVLMLAGLAGAMAGVGVVFLLERLNNTFRGAHELEEATGLRVIGALPTLGRRLRRDAIVRRLMEKPNSSLAEAVRNLRTSIFLANIDEPPRVVMVTSSVPREGKSTTSMMLAMTSRQMGRSAIIVDCDLRMPSLTAMFAEAETKGDAARGGLIALLENETTLEEALMVEPTTGLHALMARDRDRKVAANAADILSSRRFRALIGELAEAYDLVILDTPPALVVTDARIVSSLADAVVYAVKWDDTPRGAVLEGLSELRSVGAPIAGLALTLVDESRAARYAYDGYGYYRGRYRGYYAD